MEVRKENEDIRRANKITRGDGPTYHYHRCEAGPTLHQLGAVKWPYRQFPKSCEMTDEITIGQHQARVDSPYLLYDIVLGPQLLKLMSTVEFGSHPGRPPTW